MLLRGGGEGGAGFCFLFLVYLERLWAGRKKKAQPTQEEGTKEGFARWEKEIKKIKRLNIDFCCFFYHFFYICWFPKIQIFMVNGSSRNLFKMHCA